MSVIDAMKVRQPEPTVKWTVVILTLLGVLPFVLTAWWIETSWGLSLFKLYAAAILAFLAGSWWGITLVRGRGDSKPILLVVSNLVVLSAISLVLIPRPESLLGLALLFGLLVAGEAWLQPFRQQPGYYRRLRQWVSLIVIALHGFAFWRLAG